MKNEDFFRNFAKSFISNNQENKYNINIHNG